jgi:hypothetical protein
MFMLLGVLVLKLRITMVTSFKFVLQNEYTIHIYRDTFFIGRLTKHPDWSPRLSLVNSQYLTVDELEMCLNKLKEFVG